MLLAVLVLVIAIILNMIVARLGISWDISPNKQYSLSDTTESYLDKLDQENVTVDFYLLAKMDELESDASTDAVPCTARLFRPRLHQPHRLRPEQG